MTAMRPRLALLTCAALLAVAACDLDTGLATDDGSSGAEASGDAASGSAVPSGRHVLVPPTATPRPTFLVYVVKPSDSLLSIAKRLGTTGRSLAYWNRATYKNLDPDSPGYAPDRIQVGWKLRYIPGKTTDGDDDLASPDVGGQDDGSGDSGSGGGGSGDSGSGGGGSGDGGSGGGASGSPGGSGSLGGSGSPGGSPATNASASP